MKKIRSKFQIVKQKVSSLLRKSPPQEDPLTQTISSNTRTRKICWGLAVLGGILWMLSILGILHIEKHLWIVLGGIVVLILFPELKKLRIKDFTIEK
jgi:hypothetical protein